MTGPVSGDLVTFTIKVAGATIPDTYSVHTIRVEKRINRISCAELTVLDGSASKEQFEVSSSSTFVPGNEVSIEAGYNNRNKLIFKGIITAQNLRVDDQIGSALTVQCRDAAVRMTVGRNSACYSRKKDSDVISTLIGNHAGVSADVTSTSDTWPQMVQYYCSDWDFMLCRAEINGMIVATVNGKVSVFKPGRNSQPVLEIVYGDNLYAFNGDLDAIAQPESVKATSWDPKQQKIIEASAPHSYAGPGNCSSSSLSKVVGPKTFRLQTSAPASDADLQQWAKAQMLKSEYAKITGEARFQGSSLVEPGLFITLSGLGTRFNGDHFVSGVVHEIEDGNWFTSTQLGLSPQWFSQEPDVMAPPASGLLPGIQGLYNAKVKKVFDDPDSAYRILVELPLLDPSGDGLWARLSNFYSTSGKGAFFLPEVGDEVIVAFTNDDPRYPVILGSVYSADRKPFSELSPNEKNSHKAIVTNSELRIVFNDEDKILTVTTPGKNIITLDDKNKQISIKDQNGNSIEMSGSGIDIKSPKNINITASQNVNIKGSTGVKVESSGGDVLSSGLNIKNSASINYESSGGAAATVKGGATLTLKGAMVMIN